MKIGIIFPTVFSSPRLYNDKIFAPRELLTVLSNGLVDKRHEVSVFAADDFPTNAKVYGTAIDFVEKTKSYFKFRGLDKVQQQLLRNEFAKHKFELMTISNAYSTSQSINFDILHCFHDSSLYLTHYFTDLFPISVIYTLHDPLPPENSFEYHELQKFARHNFISISNSQRKSSLNLNFIDTVYHGLNLTDFEFSDKNHGYLLFMGRLTSEKGLHSAIQTAIKTNHALEIGTNFPDFFSGDNYFETEVKPFLDNPLIHEPGLVKDEYKLKLYKNAKSLLFPIEWEEPFGMVMIEAMACGTPVIAYNRGSVSEVLQDGVTGFIVDDDKSLQSSVVSGQTGNWIIKKRGIEGLVEAVNRIGEIDRKACRRHVEENFTVEKMVEGYEKVYQKVINSV